MLSARFIWQVLFCAVAVFLLAGVNPAIVLSNLLHGKDIRQFGSKNPGFTNYHRVFGGVDSILVMILDVAKVLVPLFLCGSYFGNHFQLRQLAVAFLGLCAMLGHAYPVWYHFHGGKAFLAGAATVWVVDWRVGAVATVVFLAMLFLFHYASLAALTSGFCCPVLHLLFGIEKPVLGVLLCLLLSVALLFWRHKANIKRLIRHEELSFFKKV